MSNEGTGALGLGGYRDRRKRAREGTEVVGAVLGM